MTAGSTKRPQVGDRVVITGSLHDGFMKPEDLGELITDDHSSLPFQVSFEGRTHWYGESDIMVAASSTSKNVT